MEEAIAWDNGEVVSPNAQVERHDSATPEQSSETSEKPAFHPLGWGVGFFVDPILFALLLAVTLPWFSRRAAARQRLNWGWSVGCPLGTIFWLCMWRGFGAGTGSLSATVLAISIIGWILWCIGTHLVFSHSHRYFGSILATAAFLFLAAFRLLQPEGTGIIMVEIACAISLAVAHVFIPAPDKAMRARPDDLEARPGAAIEALVSRGCL